ncbi:MAG: hypothetical protein WD030_04300, partial [Pirellulales bacterium]
PAPGAADVSETAYSPLPVAESAAKDEPSDADAPVHRGELSPDTKTSVESPAAAEQAADTHGAETAHQDEPREAEGDDDDDATGFETGYSPRIFTSIEEERQRALERERASRALVSLPTVLLALALLATGGIVWYLLQPASPATLYARISAAAGDNPAELSSVESEMDQFLNHYGGHENAEEVRQWQARLNHYRLARGATQRARRLIERYPHNAAGRAYLEAIRLAEFDPQRAIDKLEALLALYGSLPERADGEPSERRANQAIVAEARQQLSRMQAELESYAAMQLDTLAAALDHADRLADDQPQQAEAMRRAAVELYGDKPWAHDLVLRARA